MSPDYVVEIMKGLMANIMMLSAPLLIMAMAVGLIVSLFQAVTSLQEQTLTFVPKALAVTALIFFIMPWIVRTLMDFTTGVFEKLPSMVM